jgi:poly(3-hydroxybutyrate) depolymerase
MKLLKPITLLIVFAFFNTYAFSQVALTPEPSFGSNPGNLNMYSYVPSGISGSTALVIAMHGCSQTASIYAANIILVMPAPADKPVTKIFAGSIL